MPIDPDLYFELTMGELRDVAQFALASAEDAASLLVSPADPRILAVGVPGVVHQPDVLGELETGSHGHAYILTLMTHHRSLTVERLWLVTPDAGAPSIRLLR